MDLQPLNDKADDVVGACGGAAGAVIDSDSNPSVPVPLTLESTRVPLAEGSAADTTKPFEAATAAAHVHFLFLLQNIKI